MAIVLRSLGRCFAILLLARFAFAVDPVISQVNWTVKFVDSQETYLENGRATNAIDNNAGTIWHTQYHLTSPPPPHEIQINMAGLYTLTGFQYLPRQDDCANGWIKQYEFYVSLDGVNWGTPVAAGTFNYGNASTGCPSAPALPAFQVLFPATVGQYIRLRALSEINGNPWTSAAEIYALGTIVTGPALSNLVLTPSVVVGGSGSQGTVTLTSAAPSGGAQVLLSSSNTAAATVPSSVTVQAGMTSAVFPITTSAVTAGTSSTITATYSGVNLQSTLAVDPANGVLSQSGWTVRFVDSQETYLENAPATNAIDNNAGTIWHTQYHLTSPPPPHEIQINMAGLYTLTGFQYLPRQDDCANGWIKQYEFYVSTDGVNWGTPVAAGTFNYGNASTGCPSAPALPAFQVLFPATVGQYIRLRALSEINGNPWTSAAEIRALGSVAATPIGTITDPSDDVSIPIGGYVNLTASAFDPDGDTSFTYHWTFGAGSGVADSFAQNPGPIQFSTPGVFTVTMTATDSGGTSDPNPPTRTITVGLIPQSKMLVQFADSQETYYENAQAINAIDNNPATIWHTQYHLTSPPPPHEIQIDLGQRYNVAGLWYLPRQDNCSNGWIGQYNIFVSPLGVNYYTLPYGNPVSSGTFSYAGEVETCPGASAPSARQVMLAQPIVGRFVRLQALSEVNGNPWTSAAEINVLQSCSVYPSVILAEPQTFRLQTSSTLVVSASACFSPQQSGYGVRFVLDGGLQQDIYTSPFQATFTGISRTNHTVDAYVIDSSHNLVLGTGTHDQATQVAIGDYYVAMGDSITYGLYDDISSDDTSNDGRNTGGGYTPVLNNDLTVRKNYPQNVVNEGVPGAVSADGDKLVSTLLRRHPDAQLYLVMYGTNDSFGNLPSGLNLSPGDPGYVGSYKDHMQQIITAIKNAGKHVALAKVLPVLEVCCGTNAVINVNDAQNTIIQQYNQVIDQLVADPANNITVPPPDFFTYFANNYQTLYHGLVHPNGLGYQGMATLWSQALP